MKEKTISGAHERPKDRAGDADSDTGPIIEVGRDGTAKMRDEDRQDRAQPNPQTGAAVADEDPDYSPMDRSPARQKDGAPDTTSRMDESDGSGRHEDTRD